jgi:hypothetical protein
VRPISRLQWNGGFGADSGPSRGDPCRPTFRPKRSVSVYRRLTAGALRGGRRARANIARTFFPQPPTSRLSSAGARKPSGHALAKRGPAPLRASGAADADQIRALKKPSRRFLTLGGHRRGFALK